MSRFDRVEARIGRPLSSEVRMKDFAAKMMRTSSIRIPETDAIFMLQTCGTEH